MKNQTLIDYLGSRRSVVVKKQTALAPSHNEVEAILRIAARVPDHGKLAPFRFVVFDKAAQARLGDVFADAYAQKHADDPEITPKHVEHERARPQRSALMIAVVFTYKPGKIPLWEQQLACGAACMNVLHAVHAHGYVGQWLTEWPAFDADVKAHLGCTADEAIAGFFYIGGSTEKPDDRQRPVLDEMVEWA